VRIITRSFILGAAALATLAGAQSPQPASAASPSCNMQTYPISMTMTQVTATVSGSCTPAGTLTIQLYEQHAPYNKVLVASKSCRSSYGSHCAASATANRRAGSTYTALATKTAYAQP
jgi:uncharacterized protein YgbK (DUF1537 family)